MPPKSFTDLVVWKKSATLADQVHRVTARYPRDEDTTIMCDMRSSALAVSSAIAMGYGRPPRAYLKALSTARGKLARLKALCEMSESIEYANSNDLAHIRREIQELYHMITRLRTRLREEQGK